MGCEGGDGFAGEGEYFEGGWGGVMGIAVCGGEEREGRLVGLGSRSGSM